MPKKLALIFLFLLAVAEVFAVNVTDVNIQENVISSDTTSNKRKAEALFIEGKTLELKNNFIAAIENYKTALQYDKAPGIYYALGNLYHYLGKYQDAMIYLKKALDIAPNDTEYLERLSTVYIAVNDFPRAAETIEKIVLAEFFFGRKIS